MTTTAPTSQLIFVPKSSLTCSHCSKSASLKLSSVVMGSIGLRATVVFLSALSVALTKWQPGCQMSACLPLHSGSHPANSPVPCQGCSLPHLTWGNTGENLGTTVDTLRAT